MFEKYVFIYLLRLLLQLLKEESLLSIVMIFIYQNIGYESVLAENITFA